MTLVGHRTILFLGRMHAMMRVSITRTVQELIPGNWDMLSLRSSSAWTLFNWGGGGGGGGGGIPLK